MKRLCLLSMCVLLVVVATSSRLPTAVAYESTTRWINPKILYQLDPLLDARLNVVGSHNLIKEAAARWNDSSGVNLTLAANYDASKPGAITTANFEGSGECLPRYSNDLSNTAYAVVCYDIPITFQKWVFNISPRYVWHTDGTQHGFNALGDNKSHGDVLTIALHEFGHFLVLQDRPDNHGEAIMWFDPNTARTELLEDDKQGATMLYGPYTGFEGRRPTGILNYSTYKANVAGYWGNNNPPPELGPRGAEMGVTPSFGTSMELIAGTSQSPTSYIYFKLFSIDMDSGVDLGIAIPNDAHLSWCQYNWQQRTFSIDAYLQNPDGTITALRDFPNIVDQNGVRIHPAYRSAYREGQWFCFTFDLQPAAGRIVKHWYIAYDNRQTGWVGQFRGYFDSIRYTRPDGKLH